MTEAAATDEPSVRPLRRRLVQVAAAVGVIVVVVSVGPGLGDLRHQIAHASGGWLALAIALELLSALSYVVVFRAVFCPRMSWRLSYQIGMSEQAANSVLSAGGASGLALGAWALRRGGVSSDHIARRTVAFFFLTSLANVAGVVLFATLYALGVLGENPNSGLTYSFGAAALAAVLIVLSLPALLGEGATRGRPTVRSGRLASAARFARVSLRQGVGDAVTLLRQRSLGVIAGSLGWVAFDIAVLAVCFRAVGSSPAVGVLVLGYLIGQLGGNIPVPGGIGGVDAGLIGVFVLYDEPAAVTAAAVLIYHAIALWVPALLGSAAFIQLRNTLRREPEPAALCMPLADAIEPATSVAPAT